MLNKKSTNWCSKAKRAHSNLKIAADILLVNNGDLASYRGPVDNTLQDDDYLTDPGANDL